MARIYLVLIIIPFFCKTAYAQQNEFNEIYSIGIQFRLKEHSKKKVVILDSTNTQFEISIKRFMYSMNRTSDCLDSSWAEPLRNFNNSNICVKDILEKSATHSFISHKEVDKMFRGGGDGWDKFYKKYPQYAGMLIFSPIYFNTDHTQAVYYISLSQNTCSNGNNRMIYLSKDKSGKWIKVLRRCV